MDDSQRRQVTIERALQGFEEGMVYGGRDTSFGVRQTLTSASPVMLAKFSLLVSVLSSQKW